MRVPFIAATLLLILLLSSFDEKRFYNISSSPSKTIAIYDRDSLLREMPGYQRIVDSVSAYRKAYDAQEVLMFCELYKMRDQFYRDSAKFSPIIKQIKLREIEYMKQSIGEYSLSASEDLAMRREHALAKLTDQIYNATTKILIKKKKPFAVYNRAEFEALLVNNKPPGKVVDVNDQMRMLLGINKKK